MNRLNLAILSALTSLALMPSPAWCGNVAGNGGDHTRAMFIKMGSAVIDYLDTTQEGQAVVNQNQLNLGRLSGSLNAEKILVVEGSLVDWGGSAADATGTPDKITLRKEVWMDHFEKQRDVYYLVFHEMLRSASYVDDSYVISKALNPFPASKQVMTRITPLVPLVGDDLISPYVMAGSIAMGGTGCPNGKLGTSADFDSERNILDVSFLNYVARSGVNGLTLDRKACQFSIPVALPAGKRLVVTQMDVVGQADLAPGATASIRSEAFLGGTTETPHLRPVVPTSTDRLTGRVLIRRTDVLRSRCGGADLIRFNTSVDLSSGVAPDAKPNLIGTERISFYFRLESC